MLPIAFLGSHELLAIKIGELQLSGRSLGREDPQLMIAACVILTSHGLLGLKALKQAPER